MSGVRLKFTPFPVARRQREKTPIKGTRMWEIVKGFTTEGEKTSRGDEQGEKENQTGASVASDQRRLHRSVRFNVASTERTTSAAPLLHSINLA